MHRLSARLLLLIAVVCTPALSGCNRDSAEEPAIEGKSQKTSSSAVDEPEEEPLPPLWNADWFVKHRVLPDSSAQGSMLDYRVWVAVAILRQSGNSSRARSNSRLPAASQPVIAARRTSPFERSLSARAAFRGAAADLRSRHSGGFGSESSPFVVAPAGSAAASACGGFAE